MRPIMNDRSIAVIRTDALFVSAAQPSDESGPVHMRQAVAAALCQFGAGGCAERVAQEFGDHPEMAAARMRWARRQIAQVFGAGLRAPADWRAGHSGGRAA